MELDLDFDGDTTLNFDEPLREEAGKYPPAAASDEAAMAAYLDGGNIEEVFLKTKQDLQLTGKSEVIEGIKQRDLEFRKESLIGAVKDILLEPELTPERREEHLRAASELAREDASQPIWAMFQEESLWDYNESDPEYARQQEARWGEVEDLLNADALIEDIKLGVLPELGGDEGSWLDMVGDLAELGIPLNHAETMQSLYSHMMGKDYGGTGWLVVGEMYHDLKTAFANITNADEKVAWAEKLVGFLRANEGLLKDSNGFENFIIVNTLLDTSFTPGEDFDIDRLVENVVSLLDVTVIGGILVRAGRYPLSMLGIVNRTNPEKGRLVSAAALMSDDAQAARTIGQTDEQTVRGSHFPSTSKKTLSGAPDDVVGAIHEIDEELAGIFRTYVTNNPTQARRIREIAEEYGGGRIHVNKSYVNHISETEKEIVVRVGRTRASGYTSLTGAMKAAKLRGLDVGALEFYKRDKSGKIVKVKFDELSKGKPTKTGDPLEDLKGDLESALDETLGDLKSKLEGAPKGEYFYQFRKKETVAPDNPFVSFKDIVAPFGVKTRYFLDVFSIFKKEDALKLVGAEDLKQGVIAQVFQAGKHFDTLEVKGKENVLGYITKGSRDGKTFTYEQAINGVDDMKPMTKREYVAYSNLRAISDLVHKTENDRLVKWLKEKDFRAIDSKGSNLFGKRAEARDVKDSVKAMIDAKTGEAVELTEAMRKQIKTGKIEVYKLRTKETRGTNKYDYVLVNEDNLKSVKAIPDESLPYIDGYVYRRYEDNFFVEKVDPRTTLNGSKRAVGNDTITVIGAAETQSDVLALVERMTSETLTAAERAAGVTLRARMGRDYIQGLDAGEASFKLAGMNGLLHKGTRGPILNRIDASQQNMLPVVEAIHSSMNKAAHNLSIRPVVEQLEKDFVTEFGGPEGMILRGSDGTYRFPTSKSGFAPVTMPGQNKAHKQMMAAWEYINFVSRYEDPVTKNYKQGLFDIANWIDQKGWSDNFLVKSGAWAGKQMGLDRRDPLDILKGATFTGFLALNPVRQLTVQLSQHLMLAPLDPKYIASGRHIKDMATTMYGAAVRHNKELWKSQAPALAKARGLSVQKYTKEIDDWMKSGLPSGVDSYNFLAGMLFNPTEMVGARGISKASAHIGNVLKAPVRWARKLGFNAGEIGNLAVSWHMARRRFEKAGKVATGEEIAKEARALALGMNRLGELAYQRGWFKLTTQFFSMQHKGMLTIMRAATGKGNQFFTQEEAFRMAAMQVMLFGAEGVGLYHLSSNVIDTIEEWTGEAVDADLREAITNGVGTWIANQLISASSENLNGTRIDFGASYAPLSGGTHLVESIFDLLFRTNEATVSNLFGAAGSFYMRAIDEVQMAYNILQFPDPEVGNGAKVIQAMKALGRGLSSGINNYYKGSIAAQEGFFRNKHGDPTVHATAAEAWARARLGLGTFDEKEYYRLKLDKVKLHRARRGQARTTAKAIQRVYDEYNHLDSKLLTEKLNSITLYMNLIPEEERDILRPLIFDELKKHISTKTGTQSFLHSSLRNGAYDYPRFMSSMQLQTKNEKQREALRKVFDSLMADPDRNIEYKEGEE